MKRKRLTGPEWLSQHKKAVYELEQISKAPHDAPPLSKIHMRRRLKDIEEDLRFNITSELPSGWGYRNYSLLKRRGAVGRCFRAFASAGEACNADGKFVWEDATHYKAVWHTSIN